MKAALRIGVAIAAMVLVAFSSHSQPAVAQTPSPYCQPTSGVYNPTLCAQASTTYCQAGTINYNPTLCAQYGGVDVNQICQPTSASYNAALCSQYGGTPVTNISIYCQVATYNAALCAQSANSTSIYCLTGTANYNAVLCAQNGGTGAAAYCQTDTINYNASLCGQFRETIPQSVVVIANAQGLDCNRTARVDVSVKNFAGGQVPDGTAVSISASQGTVSPPQATTAAGKVTVTYTSPAVGQGVAVLTAISGTINGSTNIALNCTPSAPAPPPALPTFAIPSVFATPITTTAAPAITSAPVATGALPSVRPPNTGDAGLAAN